LIIIIGILAWLHDSLKQEFNAKAALGSGGILIFVVEIAIMVAIIMGLIVLIQGVRKVPVNYAKQIVGNRQFGGARQFLPLKVYRRSDANHLRAAHHVSSYFDFLYEF
jgi:preprotein translocase subunit SecY